MRINSTIDDYAGVRLTLAEWAAVITATEKQAEAEATVEGAARYRALSSRIIAKVQGSDRNNFDPGPEWCEVPLSDRRPIAGVQLRLMDSNANMVRRWEPARAYRLSRQHEINAGRADRLGGIEKLKQNLQTEINESEAPNHAEDDYNAGYLNGLARAQVLIHNIEVGGVL